MAARVGFDSMLIAFLDEKHTVKEEHSIDAAEGGAISATISGLGAPITTKYASNIPFHVMAKGTGAVEVEIEVADLPQDIVNKIMGAEASDKGFTAIGAKTRPPYVAMILKSEGIDGRALYYGLTRAKGSYDGLSLNTIEEGGTELNTDTIKFTCVARPTDQETFVFGDETNYTAFKEFVFPPATP